SPGGEVLDCMEQFERPTRDLALAQAIHETDDNPAGVDPEQDPRTNVRELLDRLNQPVQKPQGADPAAPLLRALGLTSRAMPQVVGFAVDDAMTTIDGEIDPLRRLREGYFEANLLNRLGAKPMMRDARDDGARFAVDDLMTTSGKTLVRVALDQEAQLPLR